MKQNLSKLLTCCACLTMVLCFFSVCDAEVEWRFEDNILLDGKPLDIAISKDGRTTYILCEKKILIYATLEKKITDIIPITNNFSQIVMMPDGERLLLTDKEKNQISVIEVTPVYDIKVGQSPVIGNKDARVHIFAFLDFQCPYCSSAYPVFDQVLKKYDGKVNLVIKHYPLRSHKFARKLSLAALAADRQGKYKEMTDLFYEKKKIDDTTILQYAQEIGLDMETFNNDIKDPALQRLLSEDVKLSQKVRVRSVPSLFVNGRVAKNRTVEALSQLIDKELKKVKPLAK